MLLCGAREGQGWRFRCIALGGIRALPPERRTPIRHGSESCRNAPDRSPALQSRLRCRGQWPDAPLAPSPPPSPPIGERERICVHLCPSVVFVVVIKANCP